MNKRVRIWLMIAAALLLLGAMAFAGAMTILRWDFATITTIRYQSKLHNITEDFQNISIQCDTANVIFMPSKNQQCQVGCYEQINAAHTVTVNGDSLVIKIEDTRKWYEHIGILIDHPIVALYLPESKYGTLTIKSDTGDIIIPKDFTFQNIDIAQDTGDVTNFASASGEVKIKTSTGDILLNSITAGTLDLTVSTGDILASDVTCQSLLSKGSTGDITLQNVITEGKFSIERSTGDVKFRKCDASEIFVTTNTGNVTGSLASEKVFFAQSDTGRIDVPKTIHGDRCEITTDTGNIEINIES